MPALRVIDFHPEHLDAWMQLNIDWISRDYVVEPVDYETLANPQKYFLNDGGAILLAQLDGKIVGTVALQPFGNGEFELAKMTVADGLRGLKIGEKLGLACLDRARKIGAKTVFLFSNTLAFEAINLYFKLGFRVVPLGNSEFKRANIKMEFRPEAIENQAFANAGPLVSTADHLLETLEKSLFYLRKLDAEKAARRPAPGKWSPKEIIGHLLDSAGNNQQKFVRAMQKSGVELTGYEQDFWVEAGFYQSRNWPALLVFWEHFNRQLAHVIAQTGAELLDNQLFVDGHGPFALRFIMTDYVEHLKHHLKDILPEADFLENRFEMIY